MKGKPVDELDDAAALERKYPPELIVKNDYFFHYVVDGFFGWYFDSELYSKQSLNDYQWLVIFNDVSVITVFAALIYVMHLHLICTNAVANRLHIDLPFEWTIAKNC